MEDKEKLQVMLPHWIEHNGEHGKEFSKWAALLEEAGEKEAATLLTQAVSSLRTAEFFLKQALEKVGGPAKTDHHHH